MPLKRTRYPARQMESVIVVVVVAPTFACARDRFLHQLWALQIAVRVCLCVYV